MKPTLDELKPFEYRGQARWQASKEDPSDCFGKHWIDWMPSIPLAHGVPVAWPYNPHSKGLCVDRREHTCLPSCLAVISHFRSTARGPRKRLHCYDDRLLDHRCSDNSVTYGWRVDLDDPQGFGYALRYLTQLATEFGNPGEWSWFQRTWFTSDWSGFKYREDRGQEFLEVQTKMARSLLLWVKRQESEKTINAEEAV